MENVLKSTKRLLRARCDELTIGAGWAVLAELTDSLLSEAFDSDESENLYETLHVLVEFARILCACNPVMQRTSKITEVLHFLEQILGNLRDFAQVNDKELNRVKNPTNEHENLCTLPGYLARYLENDFKCILQLLSSKQEIASLKEMAILSLRNNLRRPIVQCLERMLLPLEVPLKVLLRTQILHEDILGICDMNNFYKSSTRFHYIYD